MWKKNRYYYQLKKCDHIHKILKLSLQENLEIAESIVYNKKYNCVSNHFKLKIQDFLKY